MKVGEAHELVVQVEQDIAAEHDPGLRAWYGQEFELDPDLVTARQAVEDIGTMAGQLGQLANLKSVETVPGQAEAEELVEPDPIEVPPILTAEELLHEQVERKYTLCLKTYETEMDRISNTITRRSKREHQERMALRQFARSFVDFKDVTGDEHIVLRSKALGWAVTELIEEPDLIEAVMENSADYAERHGKEVTADPENFAAIIAGSLSGHPAEAHFEKILRSIFSTRHNTNDFPAIDVNLAKSVFEVRNNPAALEKIMRISTLEEPYMPSIYAEKAVQSSMEAYAANDMVEFAELAQASVVMVMLRTALGNKQAFSADAKITLAIASAARANASLLEHLSDEEIDQFKGLMFNSNSGDPVTVKRLGTDEYVDLGVKANAANEVFKLSNLYAKRMQHFSPTFYGLKAAQNILESPNVCAVSVPLSPTLSVEICVPYIPDSPVASLSEVKDAIVDYMRGNQEAYLGTALQGPAELGVRGYQETGTLQMSWRPIYPEDEKEGIILFRPSVQNDLRYYPSLQQLSLNFYRGHAGVPESDKYERENEILREEIKAGQRRFLGRRPIKFAMLEDLQETGLQSVKLRYDPKTRSVLADFLVDDGEVEITLDRNFQVDMNEDLAAAAPVMKSYYENIVLKLVKKWACSREVHTSEGVVSDQSGNAANMGHFAYLRIRDGQRYNFSEQQQEACLEEQGTDLALENERLRVLDETGQERNSTYVREAYDPNKPPLEVYYQSLS
jgi:hypothetical protein